MILQEGGYHLPALGDNARAWLRGAEGRPYDPTDGAGVRPADARRRAVRRRAYDRPR